jgi:hypothetical protein
METILRREVVVGPEIAWGKNVKHTHSCALEASLDVHIVPGKELPSKFQGKRAWAVCLQWGFPRFDKIPHVAILMRRRGGPKNDNVLS